MGGSREGTGDPDPPPPPLKNHKNIGFLCNTGLDPLKITKLTSQHSKLGNHQWPASERDTISMAFRWWAYDGPFIAVFGSSIPSSTKEKKSYQIWTPSVKTFWIHALLICHTPNQNTKVKKKEQFRNKNSDFYLINGGCHLELS